MAHTFTQKSSQSLTRSAHNTNAICSCQNQGSWLCAHNPSQSDRVGWGGVGGPGGSCFAVPARGGQGGGRRNSRSTARSPSHPEASLVTVLVSGKPFFYLPQLSNSFIHLRSYSTIVWVFKTKKKQTNSKTTNTCQTFRTCNLALSRGCVPHVQTDCLHADSADPHWPHQLCAGCRGLTPGSGGGKLTACGYRLWS